MSHLNFLKTYLKVFLIVGGLLGLLHPFLVLNFFKMPQSTYWIQGAYEKKEKEALKIEGPKLLLVGGSSVHFGLNAEMITKELKIPTINYGVMALIGLDYILYRAKKVLKPRDFVILPLEYYHYNFDPETFYSVQRDYYLLTHDRSYFLDHLSLWKQIKALYAINPTAFIPSFIETIKLKSSNDADNGMYKVKKINDYGDETSDNKNILKTFSPIHFQAPIKSFIREIKAFRDYCRANNIILLFAFPNIPYFDIYKNDAYKKEFEDLLAALKDLGIPILGTPMDAMLESHYIFDTTDHLIPLGIKKRTEKFIELLKNQPYFLSSMKQQSI